MSEDSLKEIRETIDAIDDEILRLLEQRAQCAVKVSEIKKRDGLNTYSASREIGIIERVRAKTRQGSFPTTSAERIFSLIIGASRSIVGDLAVAYVGPQFSVGYEAAVRRFGEGPKYTAETSVEAVFKSVEFQTSQFGVVPVEIASQGLMGATFAAFDKSTLKIVHEIVVSHALSENLEGSAEGKVRFFVIGQEGGAKTGNDKTTLLCRAVDKPGVLLSVLDPIAAGGLTLTRIENKPVRDDPSQCMFVLDVLGHESDKAIVEVVKTLSAIVHSCKILGSYGV